MLLDINKALVTNLVDSADATFQTRLRSQACEAPPGMDRAYPPLATARRVIVKIGTSLILDCASSKLREDWLAALADDVRRCRNRGQEILIVASGAVALGRHHLSLPASALQRAEKQAAASVGQVLLMQAFQAAFHQQGMRIAQVLLTCDDTEDRHRYLNVRAMLDKLLALGMVPLINENDAITCEGSRIGDNDRLAARLAQMLRTDVLVLLSDVDGLYTADPRADQSAAHLSEIPEITPAIRAMAGAAGSRFSTGGMVTKIIAAELAANAGCHTVIASGTELHPLTELLQGAKASWFKARPEPRTARKAWIACALKAAGALVVDGGAKRAMLEGKSLLPAGILSVEGAFTRGDIIAVRDRDGIEIARGITAYASREARLLAGHRSHVFERLLGFKGPAEIIHCDNLVLTTSGLAGRATAAAANRSPACKERTK